MKRAMVITVGTGKGVAHGISYSISLHNPDYVLFLASPVSSEKTMPEIVSKISVEYEVKVFDEVDDINIVYGHYSTAVKDLIRRGFAKENIVIDFTSGSKAMSSVITFVGITNEVGFISYVSGKREPETGRVISGTENARSFPPRIVIIENKLVSFKHFFNTYQFGSARNILDDIRIIAADQRKEEIETCYTLTEAYDLWDKFNFKAALEKFKELRDNDYLAEWGIKSKIEKNKAFLHAELQNDYCNERLYDLYLNSERRIREGKYDDAMARFYRLFEYMAQIELHKINPGLETGNIVISELPKELRDKYIGMKGRSKTLTLSLVRSFELLKELGNKTGKAFCDDFKNSLEKLLNKRNNSILAHGFGPVSENDIIEIREKVESYLLLIDSKWRKRAQEGKFPELKF